ncbi:MAG: hypothetical protein N2544_02265 [Burkholderiales bacterium]|nr:hypothetical protein [Burkholderiales bacterium]
MNRAVSRRRLQKTILTAFTAAALSATASGLPRAVVAAELGRLFLTPQQRVELDKRRAANAAEAETVVESTVTVNGVVIREGGKSTAWVNGVPQHGPDAGSVTRPGAYRDPETNAAVRAGQTLDRTRGELRDVVEPGAIRVKRAQGAAADKE